MKKMLFLTIFIMVNSLLSSQSEIMRFISMGFNALNDQRDSVSYYDYYFYGFEDFSEAFIFSDRIELNLGSMTFYPNARIIHGFPPYQYRQYSGQNNSIGYERIIPTQGFMGEEKKHENGRLVYWALTDGRIPYTTVEKIQQNDVNVIINFRVDAANEISFQHRYYNISQNELLDMFLIKYVELICTINQMLSGSYGNGFYNYDNEQLHEIINPIFQGRTARELAIFRNCLFAIKGYKFSNPSWTEFFNKYLPDYNDRYSNAEVMEMFTDNERWLLDLIIHHENNIR
jgi:hypothetical protein